MTGAAREYLPHVLSEIAEAAGEAVMLIVAHERGGQKVKLPSNFEGENWLTRLVGRDNAEKIVRRLGHGEIEIPLGPTGSYAALRRNLNRQFADLQAAGASESQTAKAMGITGRAVRYRRAKERDALPDFWTTETLPGRE